MILIKTITEPVQSDGLPVSLLCTIEMHISFLNIFMFVRYSFYCLQVFVCFRQFTLSSLYNLGNTLGSSLGLDTNSLKLLVVVAHLVNILLVMESSMDMEAWLPASSQRSRACFK